MILAMFAATILLQPEDDPPPPPEVSHAADELGECLSAGINNADDRPTPQAAARSILANCQSQLRQATEAHARWVAASPWSEAEKQEALRVTQSTIAGLEAQLVQMIRASRAD